MEGGWAGGGEGGHWNGIQKHEGKEAWDRPAHFVNGFRGNGKEFGSMARGLWCLLFGLFGRFWVFLGGYPRQTTNDLREVDSEESGYG
jgi:hypothetical protein